MLATPQSLFTSPVVTINVQSMYPSFSDPREARFWKRTKLHIHNVEVAEGLALATCAPQV